MRETICPGNGGFTLIEMIVALAILVLALAIAYPALYFFSNTTSSQLEESAQRTDIRSAASYLTNDIRYSKSVSTGSAILTVTDKNNEDIKYYIAGSAFSGNTYLVREKGSILKFQEIRNAKFALKNNNLVEISLVTDIANNKHVDFKISRWLSLFAADWQNIKPSQPLLRIYSLLFSMNCGCDHLIANDAEFFVTDSASSTLKLDNNKKVEAKTIYIGRNVVLDNSAKMGNAAYNSDIFIKGNLNVVGDASSVAAEQICVNGATDIENSGKVGNEYSEVYINGNVTLNGSGNLIGKKIYINGNVTMDSSGTLGDANSEIYVKGSINWVGNGNVYGKTIYISNDIVKSAGILGNSDNSSKIYVGGNVNIQGTYGSISGELNYVGNYKKTNNDLWISAVLKQTPQINFPAFIMPDGAPIRTPVPPAVLPSFQPDAWYTAQGYTSSTSPRSGMKYYGNSITISPLGNGNSSSNPYNPVRIVSKGDITLQDDVHAVGILFAPYGTISISGCSTFKGILIAKNIYLSTSQPIYIINLNDPQYKDLATDIPFK